MVSNQAILVATGYEHVDGQNLPINFEPVRIVIEPRLGRRGECRAEPYGYTIALREMNAAVLLHELLHVLVDRHVPHDGPGGLNHKIINTIEVGLLPHLAMLAPLAARAAAPDALRVAVEALAGALHATSDLDYDPSQEVWVCGEHGIGECEQGDCGALPWPEPNTFPTSVFALWADEQFRGVVAPYDRGDVPEMPEEAFRAYSVADWPLTDALRALLEDGAQ